MVESVRILIKVQAVDLATIDKTLESIGHLARLTVLKGREGLFAVTVTTSMKADLLEFMDQSGRPYQIISEEEIL